MPRRKTRAESAASSRPAKNASWIPGRKGQGGEGYSKGYGGSSGSGTGPSGPEDADGERLKRRAPAPKRTKSRR